MQTVADLLHPPVTSAYFRQRRAPVFGRRDTEQGPQTSTAYNGEKTLLGGIILVIRFYSAGIAGGWFNTANNAGAATVTPTPIAAATYAPSAETPTSNPTVQATSKPTAKPKATPDNTAAELASLKSYLSSQGRPLVSVLFVLHAV